MDDDLQQLEAELKSLRPVAPSRELEARIAADLNPKPRALWWTWLTLPVAAAAAVALMLYPRPSPKDSPAAPALAENATRAGPAERPVFKPVSAENVLLRSQDEGLVTLADGSAARRVRQSYIDTIVWKDPTGRASLRWSVPRQEERVVPVVFQ